MLVKACLMRHLSFFLITKFQQKELNHFQTVSMPVKHFLCLKLYEVFCEWSIFIFVFFHQLPNQSPLHIAIANQRGNHPIPWTLKLEEAFSGYKKSLCNATLLAHPSIDSPLGLFTDASAISIGACLQQYMDNNWQTLAFFSKKLTTKQIEWPSYYCEILAVQHFLHILER